MTERKSPRTPSRLSAVPSSAKHAAPKSAPRGEPPRDGEDAPTAAGGPREPELAVSPDHRRGRGSHRHNRAPCHRASTACRPAMGIPVCCPDDGVRGAGTAGGWSRCAAPTGGWRTSSAPRSTSTTSAGSSTRSASSCGPAPCSAPRSTCSRPSATWPASWCRTWPTGAQRPRGGLRGHPRRPARGVHPRPDAAGHLPLARAALVDVRAARGARLYGEATASRDAAEAMAADLVEQSRAVERALRLGGCLCVTPRPVMLRLVRP